MAASVAAAVDAALSAAFAPANNALGADSPDRVSIYRVFPPGIPTNRYAVIYAADPGRGTGGVNLLGRDGVGRFQVTCAATAPDTSRAADLCTWLVKTTLDALVGARLTVDGWAQFVVEQDEVDTYPVPVEVVPGRDTVEHALRFQFLTDRL